jgi:Cu(I)/Ag(I) efflux system membrane protein CusA/SilA
MIRFLVDFATRNRALVVGVVFAAALLGAWNARRLACDALPDTGDRQVIVFSRWDRSPGIIEDQVTYPIVTRMMGMPRVKTVRGISDYGYSWVYVIFEDGTDPYWARTRTQEYLTAAIPSLPQGVKTELGPDANGLGWVFQYVLSDRSGKHNPGELRAVQDWYVRSHLRSVPGVAEVATVGGFEPEYQVAVDPVQLRSHGVSLGQVVEAVQKSNSEASGRLLEFGGAEYMIRGRGYLRASEDLENVPVAGEGENAVVRVRDVARVTVGPGMRRGAADWNGAGEQVSGIVVMRDGANALEVIAGVKAKLKEIEPGLPAGATITPVYDRSIFIRSAITGLRNTLVEIMITVAVVILLFLGDFAAALIPIVTAPLTVLIVMALFRPLGLSLNMLSIGGLALAAGALVDASIIVVEQVHKKLELRGARDTESVIRAALDEVSGPAFFALLVTAAGFLPILLLDGQEGRLFQPLAWAKTLTILVAAILAVTLDPALRLWLAEWLPNSAKPESRHALSAALVRTYTPVVEWALGHKQAVLAGVILAGVVTIPVWPRIGTELMPPLDEGVLLYMPSTMPGISIAEATRVLRSTDRILKGFPEVESVLGKAGRATTATDPAPLSMLETLVALKPREQWRKGLTKDQLIAEMDRALKLPGVSNSWTMPVRGRMDMLATGMRGVLGIKITGRNTEGIQELGEKIQAVLKEDSATRSVFAERSSDGYYLDVDWNRGELGRQGISMETAQMAVQNAIGGETVTELIDGRARYPVNVRYMRDFRSDPGAMKEVLVTTPAGRQVPLGTLAEIRARKGPSMIRDENGLITGYVYIDPGNEDIRRYQERTAAALAERIRTPEGYAITWSGQYEALERVRNRLLLIVPLTLGVIVLLIRVNTRSWVKTGIVMLAVPFSTVGAIWALYLLDFHMSTAVWVGIIALMGVDAQTGVFMLLYLDLAYEAARAAGRLNGPADLKTIVLEGAAKRIRPKFMTVSTMAIGLFPILWSTGTGADLMKRIAVPMVGGLVSSFLMELLVYPVVYAAWRQREMSRRAEAGRWHGESLAPVTTYMRSQSAALSYCAIPNDSVERAHSR